MVQLKNVDIWNIYSSNIVSSSAKPDHLSSYTILINVVQTFTDMKYIILIIKMKEQINKVRKKVIYEYYVRLSRMRKRNLIMRSTKVN